MVFIIVEKVYQLYNTIYSSSYIFEMNQYPLMMFIYVMFI